MKKFEITFIKTKIDTYPIFDISKESYTIDYFKDILTCVGSDVCGDILYFDEINDLNLQELGVGMYKLTGEIISILNDEYEFVNLKVSKNICNILESE
jgi:hypothetical protein